MVTPLHPIPTKALFWIALGELGPPLRPVTRTLTESARQYRADTARARVVPEPDERDGIPAAANLAKAPDARA